MSYSEAFMGTGRKQTDVEKLAEDVALYQAWAAKFGSTSPSVCINKLRELLAEASDILDDYASDTEQAWVKKSSNFLTRIAPLVKQHRAGCNGQAPINRE